MISFGERFSSKIFSQAAGRYLGKKTQPMTGSDEFGNLVTDSNYGNCKD